MDRLLEKTQEQMDKEHRNAEHKRNWGNLLILVLTWIVPLVICTSIITSNQRDFTKKIDDLLTSRPKPDTTWKLVVDTLYMSKTKDTAHIIFKYWKIDTAADRLRKELR